MLGNQLRASTMTFAAGVIACVALTTGLSGCADLAGRPEPWINQDEVVEVFNQDGFRPVELATKYAEKQGPGHEEERKELRDRYLVASLWLIDAHYDQFLTEQGAIRKGGDTFAQSSAAILSATSAAVGSLVTKSVLSLVATGIIATNTAITKNYFYEQSLPMLFNQMEADRKVALLEILKNHLKSDEDYPLIAANKDLRALSQAGTFEHAFASLSDAASGNKAKAEAATKKFTTQSCGLSIQRWLASANGDVERASRMAEIDKAISDKDAAGLQQAGTSLTWLVRASEEQLCAVADALQAPRLSEADVAAQQAKSRELVRGLLARREAAAKDVAGLLEANRIEEARAIVLEKLDQAYRQARDETELSDPFVNVLRSAVEARAPGVNPANTRDANYAALKTWIETLTGADKDKLLGVASKLAVRF